MSAKDAGREGERQPRGVIAIATASDGTVIATAADFSMSSYGGFKLHDSQRMRAHDRVRRDLVRVYCSYVVTNAIRGDTCERIAEDLTSKEGGHRIVYRAVGYPDEIAAEIERR